MNNLNNIVRNHFQELTLEESKIIVGGDNVTQSVFRYIGLVWAVITSGQPHASYGRYARM